MEREIVIKELVFLKNRFNNNILLERISNILILICMVFIGSDRISFQIASMNIRIVQILLIIETIVLILLGSYRLIFSTPILLVFITHCISTIFSFNIKSSIAYDIWIIYNVLFLLFLFYSWAKNNTKEKVINFILISFLVQSIYIYIQFFWGVAGYNDFLFPMQYHLGVYRPSIWFYEPSYLATYFVIYFSISLYLAINLKCKKYYFHAINSLLSLVFITSSVGYLAIGFTVFVIIILNFKQILKINKKVLLILTLTFIFIILIISFLNLNFINVFLGRLFTSGIIDSSGGRVDNWKFTFEIFTQYPIFGIGPNAYPTFTKLNHPPTNVTLELLVNTGVIGFFTFIYFVGNILVKGYKNNNILSIYNKAIVVSIVIFIVTLQANQNYMRLYLWMFLGICLGIISEKEEIEEEIKNI
ncbi:O-antigen ligase family protein [Turicibacter sanguinis]|uniref:O-antigen ligase family protein n=1 Tax=Turicibacter sanguinis TaxID=154288 RepID=UPI0018AB3EBF|nr:O-antigen ligase family protein [Turicibacter sanguinis]MDB8558553.1 O-antigen ligase family protein [Turicibacter sanguinis]MDB8561349.1 O-antigen ligase family protein [Turicibacter sanguinis]